MSLSRAELEAMDRDELIDKVRAHERRLNELSTLVGETLIPRLDDLEDTNDDLQARVAELEGAVNTHTGNEAYEEMDRDARVFEVRVSVAKKAAEGHGAAAYTYDNVTAMFNEKPSAGYAYKLMKQAAGYDGEREVSTKDGFSYTTNPEGQQQLRCAVSDVNDEAVLHAVKNRMESGGD